MRHSQISPAMELLLGVFLCLLTFTGKTSGNKGGPHKIHVKEDDDVTLPCLFSTAVTDKIIDWKKNGKEVLFYDSEKRSRQAEEFEDRVALFLNELQSGNASMQIKEAKVLDSGTYTCKYLNIGEIVEAESHQIELTVEYILKDRGGKGAFAKPSITTVRHTQGWALLKCEVLDAYPQPSVVWCDEAQKVLNVSDEKTNDHPKGGHHNIILYTNVTKTDTYTCKATQATLYHQSKESTHIYIAGSNSRPEGKKTITFILLLLLVVVDLLLP